jgi:putative lipoic acid-binding regulatory protein
MSEQKESALQFPCDFPLKVMGRASPGFDELVVAIVLRHVGEVREGAITVQAQSQDQLDNLYRELSGHERVLMVL